jgi:hypothetical protein
VQAGRPRQWTEAKIEKELRDFLASRPGWPLQREFTAAGSGALYSAASRHGGIRRWRERMGR